MSKANEILAKIGGYSLALAAPIAVILLAIIAIKGAVWAGEYVLPIVFTVWRISVFAIIFVLLPLSFIRKTYGFASVGLILTSVIFGLQIWLTGLLTTHMIWGKIGVLIGLLFMGVGVVPMALVALMTKGMWSPFWQLLIAIAIMWAVRIYGFHVAGKSR